MISYIYRSLKKHGMYLYLEKKDNFKAIPKQLLEAFGKLEFSMMLDLSTREKLAQEDIEKVRKNLIAQGYHLQLPPPQESLLRTNERL